MNLNSLDWLQVARLVLTSRTIDEIEENELVTTGKITYQFSSKGHELTQVLMGLALRQGHDAAGVYYRSRPLMLASGLSPQEAFAADMALTGSPSEGRDVGVVYSLKGRNDGPTVLPSSGDVGAQYTPAVGWAEAVKFHVDVLGDQSWEGAVAVSLGGDGSVASNGFWAALTIATTLKLPVIFLIEDNGYGISVPGHFQTPGGDIARNLSDFQNLKIITGSGTQPEETAEKVFEAVEYARAQNGPVLLRLRVPRLTGHTYGEDQTAYKSEEQMAEERSRDPLITLERFLSDKVNWAKLKAEVEKEVRAELDAALELPQPALSEIRSHLFNQDLNPGTAHTPDVDGWRINMSEAIRRTLEHELEVNPKTVLFGEDVGPRGGVHRVTLGLQAKFGEQRVFDTSLSEEGIMGRAQGLALAGLRPIPEIQFRKYADPAYEQMHDIGWVRWRTAGKFSVPIVVRIPYGFSKKTGDPWHSVSDESVFAHMPGWRIAVPSNAADAVGLLRDALRGGDPTVFFEHRALYDTPISRRPYPGDDYVLPFGSASILQPGADLTVVSWGEMVHRCLEAAKTFGERVEVIDLRTISPWDKSAVLASVRKTGRLMVAHEDTRTAGFGAEVVSVVSEEVFMYLDAPIARITSPDMPIPYNIDAMEAVIPDIEMLRSRMKQLLDF
jgi:2-oxoisovalerate dehydrogenase E1 component